MNFRLDRLATLYLASPFRRLLPDGEPCIPILMYHSITNDEQLNVHPYFRTATSPAMFAAQLESLKTEGYRTCTLAQAVRQLEGKAETTAKSVVLTFDDGYHNFYRDAFPLLNQNGFCATVFLPTAYIGETPILFKGEACLTWSEVSELHRHGIHFGSHTVTHPQLRELSLSGIKDELANSKDAIEQKLGCSVDSFAYPYAFPQTDTDFTQILSNLLRAAGYRNGVSTVVGRANRRSQPLFLDRLPINSCDDAVLFQAKLGGAYDWVAVSQRVSKTIKSRFRHPLGRPNLRISNDFPWRTQPHQ
jgi:peptidoglycan/xylan/chitin deacetylase (PgdA/CDA1 family)